MADVPVIGVLRAHRIQSEMGRKGARMLENLVAKVVQACAEQNFGRSVFENVYLAGFEHGATMMERRLTQQSAVSKHGVADE